MNKQMMWILVVVALLVGAYAGYYYEKTKLIKMMMVSQSDMQKQIDALKMENGQLMKKWTMENEKMQPTPEPSGAMMEK